MIPYPPPPITFGTTIEITTAASSVAPTVPSTAQSYPLAYTGFNMAGGIALVVLLLLVGVACLLWSRHLLRRPGRHG